MGILRWCGLIFVFYLQNLTKEMAEYCASKSEFLTIINYHFKLTIAYF